MDEGCIEVWKIRSGAPDAAQARCFALLTYSERTWSNRFRCPQDRQTFIDARGVLRALLGRTIGVDPERVPIQTARLGKPYLSGSDLEFNVSHSGQYIVIALARGLSVGVDVEAVNPHVEVRGLIRRYFHSAEIQEFDQFPKECQRSAFFRYWTRKEAYLKGLGEGLSTPLHSVNVSIRSPEVAPWTLRDVTIDSSYAAALAYLGEPVKIVAMPIQTTTQVLAAAYKGHLSRDQGQELDVRI